MNSELYSEMIQGLERIPSLMQPQDQSQPIIVGQPAQFGGGAAPYAGQAVVMAGPPSQAAKVIGILVMVYAGFSILGGIFNAFAGPWMNEYFGAMSPEYQEFATPDWVYYMQGLSSVVLGFAFLYSGWMIQDFQRKGIYYTWGILGISFLLAIVLVAVMPFPDVEGVDSGSMRMISVGGTVVGALCSSGICGVLTAIPLFMNNHGMK